MISKENTAIYFYIRENIGKKVIYTTQKVERCMSQNNMLCQNPFKGESKQINGLWNNVHDL